MPAPPEPRPEVPPRPPAPETTGSIGDEVPGFLRRGGPEVPPPAPEAPPRPQVQDPMFAKYLADKAIGDAKDAAARAELEAQQTASKKAKTSARLGKMKAAQAGQTTAMPLTGRAALDAIRGLPGKLSREEKRLIADQGAQSTTSDLEQAQRPPVGPIARFAKDTSAELRLGNIAKSFKSLFGKPDPNSASPMTRPPPEGAEEAKPVSEAAAHTQAAKDFVKEEPKVTPAQFLKMTTATGGAYDNARNLIYRSADPDSYIVRRPKSQGEVLGRSVAQTFQVMRRQFQDWTTQKRQWFAKMSPEDKAI